MTKYIMIRFRVISGTLNVTQNHYLYEYCPDGKTPSDIIVADCGVSFPDLEMRGVDLVIPDFSYLIENKDKVRGYLISQGHEDHQGALPFALREVKAPVFVPKLTAEFIKDKLIEYEVTGADIRVYDPDQDTLEAGPFKIQAFWVSHSIPETVGFAIDTPDGRVFHVAEHKFDPRPVVGRPFDIKRAVKLANEKEIMFLASDSLGSNKPGTTPPEADIGNTIDSIVKDAKGTVFFSCISSNISRIQNAINSAEKYGRKVAFIGRSVQVKSEISNKLGYLKYQASTVVDLRQTRNIPRSDMLYIIAGSFGQPGSSLFRLSQGEHRRVQAQAGDTAILASYPGPPYSKENIDFIVDSLIELGLDVHYYDSGENLHVSGHGAQEDIVKLFEMVKPKYMVPTGGTIRFMQSYKRLAVEKYGADKDQVFMLKPGESVEFDKNSAKKGDKISVKQVLVDGLGIGDVGEVVLGDRETLSQSGFLLAIIQIDTGQNKIVGTPEIVTRGFVFQKKEKQFLQSTAKDLTDRLNKIKKKNAKGVRFAAMDFLKRYIQEKTGRSPMILPVVIEV